MCQLLQLVLGEIFYLALRVQSLSIRVLSNGIAVAADSGGGVDGCAATRGGDLNGNGLIVFCSKRGSRDGNRTIFCCVETSITAMFDGNRNGGCNVLVNINGKCIGKANNTRGN